MKVNEAGKMCDHMFFHLVEINEFVKTTGRNVKTQERDDAIIVTDKT